MDISDGFRVLSLAHRSGGFVRMFPPLSDRLTPKGPLSCPLLCMVKDCYMRRLLGSSDLEEPSFKECRWIISEGVNVVCLLDVFTLIDSSSEATWESCARFFDHFYSYKPQHVVLGPKAEQLPGDYPSKIGCLFRPRQLLPPVDNYPERKRLAATPPSSSETTRGKSPRQTTVGI